MAKEPTRPFSASELGTIIGIHRATAYSLLTCLAEMGIVVRDPDSKAYWLGPELVRLGRATVERFAGLDALRAELCSLADTLDVGGLACIRVGDEQLIVEQVGSEVREFGLPPAAAARVALIPPVGVAFFAWSSIDEIERWIDRAPEATSEEARESYRRVVTAVRARGYSIGSEVEFELQLEEVLAKLTAPGSNNRLTAALRLADLVRRESVANRREVTPRRGVRSGRGDSATAADEQEAARPRSIDHIIAPIFDATGAVSRSITLFGRPGQITDANLSDFAEPLLGAVERLTQALGGQWPGRTRWVG